MRETVPYFMSFANSAAAIQAAGTLQRSMTSIQIVSDTHLEFRKKANIPKISQHAKNLALLGDIGKPFMDTYKHFLEEQSQTFEKVFVLMGNHEYYNHKKTTDKILAQARLVCSQYDNVHLLERDTYDLTENTRVIGCTLWSAINHRAALGLSDMVMIHNPSDKPPFKELLSREVYYNWHIRDVSWIQKEIDEAANEGKNVVVLTHHGPMLQMSGRFLGDSLNPAFVSDLKHLFKEPVIAFASGHVHSNVDITYNGIRSVSNTLGYPGEDTGYKENVVINVP